MTQKKSNSNQQKYYDEHYSISDNLGWKNWQPNPILSTKSISEFAINANNAQEIVLSIISSFAPFKSTLDIGCSAGDFIIPISKVSINSYGVDIVNFALAWSTLSSEYNIHCSQLNLDESDLPFDDSSFDLVTMLMVLEHVFDVHHAVKEVSRVLQTDGIAVIQVPNIGYIRHRIDLLQGKLPCTSNTEKKDNKTEWDGQHLHYFTLSSLKNLLSQYGLGVKKILCSGKLNTLRSFYTSALGADLIVVVKKMPR